MCLRRVAVGASLLLSLGMAASPEVPAAERVSCSGSTFSGMCYTTLVSSVSSAVVASSPIDNSSSYEVEIGCASSSTISKTMTAVDQSGVSAPASMAEGIRAAVQESVDIPLELSIRSTAQLPPEATAFTLAPGQAVSCDVVYTEVTATVTVTTYSGSTAARVGTYRAAIPSSISFELH